MNALPANFDERAVLALQVLDRQAELRAAVWAEVNAFYQRHPALERTDVGAALIAMILISAWADMGSPAAQQISKPEAGPTSPPRNPKTK